MPISRTRLIEHFGADIVDGRPALFIGAGLSAGHCPAWDQLLEPMREKTSVPKIEDYPLLAEYIIYDYPGGRASFDHALHKPFQVADAVPSPTLAHLPELPILDWWTTNYDCLIEATGLNFAVVHRDGRGLSRSNMADSPRLVKMHGSIRHGDSNNWAASPVISRADYEAYESAQPRIWALLKATFLTKQMLFMGFGFQDPNIDLMLRLSRSLDREAAPTHYVVIRVAVKNPGETEDDFATRNALHDLRIRDIEGSGIDVCLVGHHDENREIAQALVRRTRRPAVFVAGSFDKKGLARTDPRAILSRALGEILASINGAGIRSLAGEGAVQVTEGFAGKRRDEQRYDPKEMVYYFRWLPNGTPLNCHHAQALPSTRTSIGLISANMSLTCAGLSSLSREMTAPRLRRK